MLKAIKAGLREEVSSRAAEREAHLAKRPNNVRVSRSWLLLRRLQITGSDNPRTLLGPRHNPAIKGET